MQLVYQEALLMIPNHDNRYEFHRTVTDHIYGGKHREQKLNITYTTTIHPQTNEYVICRIRGSRFPDEAKAKSKSFDMEERQYHFKVNLCLRKITKKGDNEHYEGTAQPEEYEEFVARKLRLCGIELDQLIHTSEAQSHQIILKKHKTQCKSSTFEFLATVTDAEKAAMAYLQGIGSRRNFGFGMLEVIGE